MTDRLDPIHKPEVAEVRTVGEKRYKRHGKLVVPPGLKFWSIDKAGNIEEVLIDRKVAIGFDGEKLTANKAAIDTKLYRYCIALNRDNARRKFDQQAKARGPM